MRKFLTARIRWLRVNWFWPLALLTLPSCGLETGGTCGVACSFNANPGPQPWSSAVFCDIEKPGARQCATDEEINSLGIRLAAGAEALVARVSSNIGLDYSSAAQAHCGAGRPEKVAFEGKFPDGSPLCLSCLVAPTVSDANTMCVKLCEDITEPNVVPASAATAASCASRAHVSINASAPTFCFGGACSSAGNFLESFVSPRRSPEPVIWQDLIGVATSGPDNNTLKRTAPETSNFDAGATSSQTITGGDGYVEFTATGVTQARLGGLSKGNPPDTNPDYTDIDFALDVFKNGCFYVFEKGTQIAGPIQTCTIANAWGSYQSGDKFRVSVTDNFDGTATVNYIHVTAACATHVDCPAFYTSLVKPPYPFRVDTSFRELNGTLDTVVLVRIR